MVTRQFTASQLTRWRPGSKGRRGLSYTQLEELILALAWSFDAAYLVVDLIERLSSLLKWRGGDMRSC